MADIGRLLLLPPPALPGRNTPARIAGRSEGDLSGDLGLTARVDEAGDATSNTRGKQFRFRVLDGGRGDSSSNSLGGNAEVPARTDPNAAGNGARQAAGLDYQAGGNRGAAGDSKGGIPLGTPQATFLAQLIAQEQLPQGLYNPPVKTADRAYRQAGGEPALTDGATSTARFRMAV